MQKKKTEKIITKLNIITSALIIMFIVVLFSGKEQFCSVIYPEPAEAYRKILGDPGKDLRERTLYPGRIIKFQFNENKKSLGELYALNEIRFIPEDRSIEPWEGEDKIAEWNSDTPFVEKMQRFRVKFTLQVPENERLSDKTVKGDLFFKLSYPVLKDYTKKIDTVIFETIKQPLSIHIFSKDRIIIMDKLKNQMLLIWVTGMAFFLLPVIMISAVRFHKNNKKMPPRVE